MSDSANKNNPKFMHSAKNITMDYEQIDCASFDALAQALMDNFNRYKNDLQGRRVWLACSGGRDSLSLALICHHLFLHNRIPFLPQLLHVNHGMQAANERWAGDVKQWANDHDMPCQILHLNECNQSEDSLDKADHLGDDVDKPKNAPMNEQAARKARYQSMMAIMNKGDVLLLGHHQDDQVETVLMRLFNGAGVNGLGGMREWTSKTQTYDTQNPCENYGKDKIRPFMNQKTIWLWRPWLTIQRQQITVFAQSIGLSYIDDPTNVATHANTINESNEVNDANHLENTNDRAWLRSVLIPVIKQRYPTAPQAIERSSHLMQAAATILTEQAEADLNAVNLPQYQVGSDANVQQSVLDIKALQQLSPNPARLSSTIYQWLTQISQSLPPSKRLVDDCVALSTREDGNHQTSLTWRSGRATYHIRRYQQRLYGLHSDWLQWLQSAPSIQHFSLQSEQTIHLKSLNQPNNRYDWRLEGYQTFVNAIKKHAASSFNEFVFESMWLTFMPLPRKLKLTLADRQGSKSGKKLLQALDVPAFERQSVVLCVLTHRTDNNDEKNSCKQNDIPLFIITTQSLHAVQSVYTASISALIEQQQLYSKIVCEIAPTHINNHKS